MTARTLGDLVLAFHFAFIVFAVLGGLLVLWKSWIAWLHIPSVLWAGYVNLFGQGCPLTSLENRFRHLAGQAGYEGGFIQHYLTPLVYPGVMPERWGLVSGFSVLIWNVLVYTLLVVTQRRSALLRAARIIYRGDRRSTREDYFFGVLHSRIHELWARRMGTWMGAGNDLRYTPTTCFESFPLPWPPGEEPNGDSRIEAIAEAARRLDELRPNQLNPKGASEAELKKRTLTNLYNDWPTWLENAHKRLDEAVFAAYGWPTNLSDEEVLRNLLTLNLKRAGKEAGAETPSANVDSPSHP